MRPDYQLNSYFAFLSLVKAPMLVITAFSDYIFLGTRIKQKKREKNNTVHIKKKSVLL